MNSMGQKVTSATGPHFYNLADFVHRNQRQPLRILMLADSCHAANVVIEHINGFVRHSRHKITIKNPIHEPVPNLGWFLRFDAIIIHYSIYILGDYFLPQEWSARIERFPGVKAQIIQDEHRRVNAMKERMAVLGISAVFSSLEVENAQKVYSGEVCKNINFFSCLPGYVADSFFNFSPPSIAGRALDIVYRGRTLPAYLGRHAQEKKAIGDQVLEVATARGLKVDISSVEDQRIYGDDWFKFIMSSRATLGVEGGASIFDFDGSITESVNSYLLEHPEAKFEDVWIDCLAKYEGNVEHKTITPKIFEAIACKTALVLYPGKYRGVLKSGRHYIELARDGSNIHDVFEALSNDALVQDIVDCAYREILLSDDFHNNFYVKKIDSVLDSIFYGKYFFHGRRWQKIRETPGILFSEFERWLEQEIRQKLG